MKKTKSSKGDFIIMAKIGKPLGYVRRHNKALLKQLLKEYLSRGGFYENFGQTTIRKMNDTVNTHLSSIVSYQDLTQMQNENRQMVSLVGDCLYRNRGNMKVGVSNALAMLKETKLYTSLNLEKRYNF